MSAWLCSEEHINLLTSAMPDAGADVFKMLVKENLRSLAARYPGRDFLREWKRDAKQFKFTRGDVAAIVAKGMDDYEKATEGRWCKPTYFGDAARLVQTQIVKACNCYDYQACETSDYRETKAAKYVDAVRSAAINAGGLSEGKLYEALVWGL